MKILSTTLLALIFIGGMALSTADVLTYHYDNSRTGLNPNETILTPANVNSNQFGLLFEDYVDGLVDAGTLYVSNLTIPGKGVCANNQLMSPKGKLNGVTLAGFSMNLDQRLIT